MNSNSNSNSISRSKPNPRSKRGLKLNSNNSYTLKKLIFPPMKNNGDMNKLKIDDESIKYVTFYISAQEITNVIMNNLNDFPCPEEDKCISLNWKNMLAIEKMKYLIITEMTAGIGGNVLNFANYFKCVNAIEIDPIRCKYLKTNTELYGLLNVNYYNDDSLKMLLEEGSIKQDIIFFDPPWGGTNYKTYTKLKLQFGVTGKTKSIEDICICLLQKNLAQMIILKLPNNYDFEYFKSALVNYWTVCFNLERMTAVIIKNSL